jgi:hypothetical protein
MKKIIALMLVLTAVLTGCKDEYDGLLNVDPYPANAVTFPDATENGFVLMDDNAFIINQNSVANGRVTVQIKGPADKQIVSVEPRAQRFRGTIVWPNISPSVPTAAAQRAPAAFSRTMTSLGVASVTPGSEVTYAIDLGSLPASLTNATLGAVAAPSGTTPAYDVFRFYFLVRYSDNSSVLSNEVRVVVKG